MNGWQDIATAPRDGTEILVFEADYKIGNTWAKGSGVSLVMWADKGTVYLDGGAEGWMYPHSEQDEQGGAVFVDCPTHWHLLPAPPEGEG